VLEVDKGVPLPQRTYPFEHMVIGDSFTIEYRHVASVRTTASRYGRRHNKRFKVLKDGNVWRCWRTA